MSLFDDNPLAPPDPNSDSQTLDSDALASSPEAPVSESLGGDPISFAAAAPAEFSNKVSAPYCPLTAIASCLRKPIIRKFLCRLSSRLPAAPRF